MDWLKPLYDLWGGNAPGSAITTAQAVARAVMMYAFALVAVRIEKNRLIGQNTVFDMVLIILLGSLWSRAVNGSGTLSATLLATVALLAMQSGVLRLTYRSARAGSVLKGKPLPLIKEGNVIEENLRRISLSRHDLGEALRLNANLAHAEQVQEAYFERNGQVGVVPKPLQIVDIKVEAGVQTVRVRLS